MAGVNNRFIVLTLVQIVVIRTYLSTNNRFDWIICFLIFLFFSSSFFTFMFVFLTIKKDCSFSGDGCPPLSGSYHSNQITRNTYEMSMLCSDHFNIGSTCSFKCEDDKALYRYSFDKEEILMYFKKTFF